MAARGFHLDYCSRCLWCPAHSLALPLQWRPAWPPTASICMHLSVWSLWLGVSARELTPTPPMMKGSVYRHLNSFAHLVRQLRCYSTPILRVCHGVYLLSPIVLVDLTGHSLFANISLLVSFLISTVLLVFLRMTSQGNILQLNPCPRPASGRNQSKETMALPLRPNENCPCFWSCPSFAWVEK